MIAPTTQARARRGTTLIEAVIVVLVLAIAVPPTISGMMGSASRRADAIQITRATTLAAAVLDQVMCDAVTVDVGLAPTTYLDTAGTGLRSRLDTITSLYTNLGMSYTVTIGPLVSSSLAATGVVASDLYREITATVSYSDSAGVARSIPVTTMISIP